MFSANVKDDNMYNAKDAANSAVAEAHYDLRQVARESGEKVRSLYNAACDEMSHAKDTVTTQIRTKPVQSSVIALGVGFMLGALFRR